MSKDYEEVYEEQKIEEHLKEKYSLTGLNHTPTVKKYISPEELDYITEQDDDSYER